ncbi:MAG: hypothetical protein GY757_48045, partial [bacterium]|nr:hypothetical protein [bacterium]
WDSVGKLLADVNAIQMEIKQNPVSVDDYSAKNPVFKKEYNALKGDVLKHIDINTAAIEEWRTAICSKIAGSKNTLDNISKYYKPAEGSYYVDTEE